MEDWEGVDHVKGSSRFDNSILNGGRKFFIWVTIVRNGGPEKFQTFELYLF